MKPKFASLVPTIILTVSTLQAAPLLTDNFNTGSYGASTFNNFLAADQGGSLATVSYSASAPGGDWSTQHSNGGAMLIANAGSNNWVSLNHDFSVEANLANKPLTIQFDAWTTDGAAHSWLGFGIGASQGTDFYAQPYGKNFVQSAGTHNYRFVISDTAGTGSAFNGITNGAKVDLYVDSVFQSTTTVTLSPGAGYITFKQDQWDGWSIGRVDNLSIEMDTAFPAGETLTWTGTQSANWDETSANWTSVNSFTNWYSNDGNPNSVLFNATGAAQPVVNLSLTRPLRASSVTFDTAGYTIAGSVTFAASTNLVANADATISATLQGGVNLAKSGSGVLSLTGANSYSGVTIFNSGVLNAASIADNGTSSSLGTGTGDTDLNSIGLLFHGGTLQYTGSTAQSTNRAIRLGLEGGTIDASGSNPAATLSFTSTASPNFFSELGNRTLTLTGSNTGNNTFAMAIGQAGGTTSLIKSGAGKWVLTGANTYTGSTTINGGTLSINSAYLDNNSAVSIAAGAVLELNHTDTDVVGSLEINGSGPLPAGLYNASHPTYGAFFAGTGSLVVFGGADGSWSSLVNGIWDTTDNWDSGIVANGYNHTATFNTVAGATVTLSANKTIGHLLFDGSDYIIAGSGTLTLDALNTPTIQVGAGRSASITANIAGTMGVEKSGDGTLVFSGIKSYTGGTTVAGGTLELSGAAGGNGLLNGSLTVSPGATVNITAGDGTGFGWNNPVNSVTVNGGTINANSGCHIGFGTAATIALNHGATIQGGWQWNGDSMLTTSSSGDNTNTIGGNLVLRSDNGANHTFNVSDGASATDLLISGSLSDQSPEVSWVSASGITKSGTGTMVLSGTNSYDGDTVVSDGTLEVTTSGSLKFRPTTNGASNKVSGSSTAVLSFAGNITLDLSAANTTSGNVWNLFNLASFSGSAPSLAPTAVTSNLGTFTQVSPGVWELAVTSAKWSFTTADGNLSYTVTATDYDNWTTANNLTGGPGADADGDGLTNFQEYAFGLNPANPASANPIPVTLNPANGSFSYSRRLQSLTNLTYKVFYSTTLQSGGWTEDTGAVQGTPTVNGETETVPVTISGSLLTHPKLFIQVRTTSN